jgi:hemerythrin
VAKFFDDMFQFEHAINSYIPGRSYMPVGYGQLGCSGFVIADARGNFVSRKTKAYLQYGENAFRDVEVILERLVGRPSLVEGRTVENKRSNTKDQTSLQHLGIASMDEEHALCENILQVLIQQRSVSALEGVLKALTQHFAHEEAILVQHKFGGDPTDPFSAINSHRKDHERILQMACQELERMKKVSPPRTCSSNLGETSSI